jgi:hypothetical protein
VWAVKLRVKAVTSGFLGMSAQGGAGDARREGAAAKDEETGIVPKLPQPMELLKGIFGR